MKILMIVSRDYGELGNAMYFLERTPLATAPVLMLPGGMKEPGLAAKDFDIRRYDSLKDIQAVVRETEPDAVLLFSGYLLAIGRHFSLLHALQLLLFLRRRGTTVLTSDPFIGMIRSPLSLDFSVVLASQPGMGPGLPRIVVVLLSKVLSLRIYLMYRALRDVCHVYPAPIQETSPGRPRLQLNYFNPELERASQAQAEIACGKPVWVFTLSRIDCLIQSRRHGSDFIEQLAARLIEVAASGRRAVLVGTPELAAQLRPMLPTDADISLRGEESYSLYTTTLMAAEYAFFWNYFSFSIIHRVIASRPVFFFDEGHMVDILPGLSHEGIRSFYGGWRPPLRSLSDPLRAETLAADALDVQTQFAAITARLRSGMTPLALLQLARESQASRH
ncbi:MAG: hypothetical protein ACOH1R_10055 [Luteimonas sp.]